MTKSNNKVQMWVAPEFKKWMKKTAIEKDCKNILEFSRELTRMPEPFESLKKKRRNLWE